MKKIARPFLRRILAVHFVLLVVAIVSVLIAARELYLQTRDQTLNQVRQRQELIAAQTARAIEDYYASLRDMLDLVARSDGELWSRTETPGDAGPRLLPAVWRQLEGRISQLFVVAGGRKLVAATPPSSLPQAQLLVQQAGHVLAEVSQPAIVPLHALNGQSAHLLCLPVETASMPDGRLLLVAAVPTSVIEQRFLGSVNRDSALVAMLVDEDQRVLAAAADGASTLPARVRQALRSGDDDPAWLTSRGSVKVLGSTWQLRVSSRISEVDALVDSIFRGVVFWGLLVLMVITLILISTSTQLIRERLNVERLKSEIVARELRQARRIQLAWLPARSARIGNLQIAAANEAASHISGDFYDWFELPDGRTVVTIGDVTGHGMAAAFLMATAQLLIRTTMLRVGEPGRCLEEVNRQLCGQVFSGQFVTALIVAIDSARAQFQAATAGHFPPLLDDGTGMRPVPMCSQLVLGVQEEQSYPTETVSLPDEFALVLYTDGLVEVRGPDGSQFTCERLCQAAGRENSADDMVRGIIEEVRRFVGPGALADDLTLVAVRGRCSRSGRPPQGVEPRPTVVSVQR